MGLGVLEPKILEHVPGTALLVDDDSTAQGGVNTDAVHALKHATGKNSHIILVPQPSDSPNDPLNWPNLKRELCFWTLCIMTVLAGALGPILSAVTPEVAITFDTTFTKVSQLTGWQLCGEGAIGLFIASIGSKYGKRPIYLMSATFLLIGTIWGAAAHSYGSFVGSRLIQGFGIAAYEVFVPASIGDMYFTHERGHRIAIWTLSLMAGTFFGPVFTGIIAQHLTWRYMFIIEAAIMGPFWVATILFVPEHAFNRNTIYEIDTSSTDDIAQVARLEKRLESNSDSSEPEKGDVDFSEEIQHRPTQLSSHAQDRKRTFKEELSPYSGTYSPVAFWKLFIRPVPLMVYPAAIYLYLMQGTMMVWTIGISIILAILFGGPPYNFDTQSLGLLYIGPFLGVLLAYAGTGYTSDMIAKYMARKNKNVYEPEFRLLLAFPVLIFGAAGFFGFGNALTQGASWAVCVFAWSVSNFATIMCLNVTNVYLIDGHRDLRNELYVSCLLFKNFFAFGETYWFNSFLTTYGPAKMFDIIGGVHIGVCLLTIPMYLFGKYSRAYLAKWKILEILHLN